MSIMVWSSDVCSSDLAPVRAQKFTVYIKRQCFIHVVVSLHNRGEAEKRTEKGKRGSKRAKNQYRRAAPKAERFLSGQTETLHHAGNSVRAIAANAGTMPGWRRSEEHTSELQSLMRNSYAVFSWKKQQP